jgi:hypothetical protein
MSKDDDNDQDALHSDNKDWAALEEEHGREWVEAELDAYDPDPSLVAYLNETDTSCSKEDLGLDDDGNRDDD